MSEKTSAQRHRENCQALQRVVEHFGNRNKLALALELRRQSVSIWETVPPIHARKIAQISGLTLDEVLPHPIP